MALGALKGTLVACFARMEIWFGYDTRLVWYECRLAMGGCQVVWCGKLTYRGCAMGVFGY